MRNPMTTHCPGCIGYPHPVDQLRPEPCPGCAECKDAEATIATLAKNLEDAQSDVAEEIKERNALQAKLEALEISSRIMSCLINERLKHIAALQAKLEAAEREMQALVLFTHNYRTNLASAHEDVRALADAVARARGEISAPGFGIDGYAHAVEIREILTNVISRPTVRTIVEGEHDTQHRGRRHHV